MVCQWLFEMNGGENIDTDSHFGSTSMHGACKNGHLSVCRWLLQVSSPREISRKDKLGQTAMHYACMRGYLSVCQWLIEMGAAEDISKADKLGRTPMHLACSNGHLVVCQWLFEVGASGDIRRLDIHKSSPMSWACRSGQLRVCQWLVLNGALHSSTIEHIDEALVQRDMPSDCRYDLLAWARNTIATHETFFNVFLRASVVVPRSQLQMERSAPCRLPKLCRVSLRLLRLRREPDLRLI